MPRLQLQKQILPIIHLATYRKLCTAIYRAFCFASLPLIQNTFPKTDTARNG